MQIYSFLSSSAKSGLFGSIHYPSTIKMAIVVYFYFFLSFIRIYIFYVSRENWDYIAWTIDCSQL